MSDAIILKILHVGWTQLGQWWNFPDLSAPYWRLYWNSSPGACIKQNGECFTLDPSKITLIPSDTAFASVPPPRVKNDVWHFYIHFLFEYQTLQYPKTIFSFRVDPQLNALLNASIEKFCSFDIFKAKLLAMQIITHLIHKLPVSYNTSNSSIRIQKAIEILKNHLEPGIPNDELASRFSMSTNAFLRLFKKSTGTSPQKYLNKLRIEQACHMLHYTEKSIKEIAFELGFCDRYHFTKIFRNLRGEGPATFRKKFYCKKSYKMEE